MKTENEEWSTELKAERKENEKTELIRRKIPNENPLAKKTYTIRSYTERHFIVLCQAASPRTGEIGLNCLFRTWAIFSIMKIDTKTHFHFQGIDSIDFSGVLIKKYEDTFLNRIGWDDLLRTRKAHS